MRPCFHDTTNVNNKQSTAVKYSENHSVDTINNPTSSPNISQSIAKK